MTHDEAVETSINYIRDRAKEYGEVKGERIRFEEFRKTKKALLMQLAPDTCKTVSDRENFAYAHAEYQDLLMEIKLAVVREEELRLKIKSAELKFEQWRTMQANNRAEMGRYGN